MNTIVAAHRPIDPVLAAGGDRNCTVRPSPEGEKGKVQGSGEPGSDSLVSAEVLHSQPAVPEPRPEEGTRAGETKTGGTKAVESTAVENKTVEGKDETKAAENKTVERTATATTSESGAVETKAVETTPADTAEADTVEADTVDTTEPPAAEKTSESSSLESEPLETVKYVPLQTTERAPLESTSLESEESGPDTPGSDVYPMAGALGPVRVPGDTDELEPLLNEAGDGFADLTRTGPSSKKSKRLSTISMASSIAALAPFIWSSKDDRLNNQRQLILPHEVESPTPKAGCSTADCQTPEPPSARTIDRTPRQIQTILSHAAASKQPRLLGVTAQTVADWKNSLDESFEECLGNVSRFKLQVPAPRAQPEQSKADKKSFSLKSLKRRSRLFLNGLRVQPQAHTTKPTASADADAQSVGSAVSAATASAATASSVNASAVTPSAAAAPAVTASAVADEPVTSTATSVSGRASPVSFSFEAQTMDTSVSTAPDAKEPTLEHKRTAEDTNLEPSPKARSKKSRLHSFFRTLKTYSSKESVRRHDQPVGPASTRCH